MLLHYLVGKTIEKYSSRFKFRSTKYRHYGGSNAKFDRPLNFPCKNGSREPRRVDRRQRKARGTIPKTRKKSNRVGGEEKKKGEEHAPPPAPRPPWPLPPPAARRSCWGPPPSASSTRGASQRLPPPRPRRRSSSTRAPA